MFTQNSTPTCSTLPLTEELAQEIYEAIKKNGSWQKAFTADDTDFDLTNCKAVAGLIKNVQAEVQSKMSGSYMISPAIPAVYSEYVEGEEPTIVEEAIPAVYFAVTDQQSLVESITSILDTETVVSDIIAYNGSYDPKRTWEEYVASFEVPEGV
jgi:hypothetical protein